MKRTLSLLILLALVGSGLAGCNPAQAAKSGTVCLASTAIAGVVAYATKQATLLLTALPNCVEFGYDLFAMSQPTDQPLAASALNPDLSPINAPTVKLSDQAVYTGSTSGAVLSLVFSNCSPIDFNPSFDYLIPYKLSMDSLVSIGEKNQLQTFKSKTNEASPFGELANTLFNQYNPPPQIVQTGIAKLTVPPQKQIKATITATVSYKYGAARVDDNGSTSYLPWLITDSKPSIQVQLDPQNCG